MLQNRLVYVVVQYLCLCKTVKRVSPESNSRYTEFYLQLEQKESQLSIGNRQPFRNLTRTVQPARDASIHCWSNGLQHELRGFCPADGGYRPSSWRSSETVDWWVPLPRLYDERCDVFRPKNWSEHPVDSAWCWRRVPWLKRDESASRMQSCSKQSYLPKYVMWMYVKIIHSTRHQILRNKVNERPFT